MTPKINDNMTSNLKKHRFSDKEPQQRHSAAKSNAAINFVVESSRFCLTVIKVDRLQYP
ncbi:hypothetical protein MTR_8g086305 [Medicago truncatula]|uniref:Uncharacterized protein n=1 Tax=Medicago truncatula TaxID=3880 RepID=A0A072TTB2_MEDTR|nr:hypothetical protein MTR_8g086305 [Medicago truncatula]